MAADRTRTGWFPDLSNRYRSRYWNGRDWTAWVLDSEGLCKIDRRLQGRFAVRRAHIWADIVFENRSRICHLQVTGDELTWMNRTIGFGAIRAAACYEVGSGRARVLQVDLEMADGNLSFGLPVGELENQMARKCESTFATLKTSFHSNLYPRLVGELAHRLNADETLMFGSVLVSKDHVSKVARFGRSKRVDATQLVDVRGDDTEIYFISQNEQGDESVAITLSADLPNAVILPAVFEQLRHLVRDRRQSTSRAERRLPLGALEAWEEFIAGHPEMEEVPDSEEEVAPSAQLTVIGLDEARRESELGPAGPSGELPVSASSETPVAELAATIAAKVAAAVATEFAAGAISHPRTRATDSRRDRAGMLERSEDTIAATDLGSPRSEPSVAAAGQSNGSDPSSRQIGPRTMSSDPGFVDDSFAELFESSHTIVEHQAVFSLDVDPVGHVADDAEFDNVARPTAGVIGWGESDDDGQRPQMRDRVSLRSRVVGTEEQQIVFDESELRTLAAYALEAKSRPGASGTPGQPTEFFAAPTGPGTRPTGPVAQPSLRAAHQSRPVSLGTGQVARSDSPSGPNSPDRIEGTPSETPTPPAQQRVPTPPFPPLGPDRSVRPNGPRLGAARAANPIIAGWQQRDPVVTSWELLAHDPFLADRSSHR